MTALWKTADTLPDGLATMDGRRFRVLYPGRLNTGAGPDFHDSVLLSETGERVMGDVELHVEGAGWRGHGHHTDPNYNGVVLNVILHPRQQQTHVLSQGKQQVPVAVLAVDTASQKTGGLPELWSTDFRLLSDAQLGRMLDEAGDRRFLARSHGFAWEMVASKPEQVLWRGLLEALGYSTNRKPFRELADAVLFFDLCGFKNEPATTRLLAMKTVLLDASGLMGFAQSEGSREIQVMRKLLPRQRSVHRDSWNLFRIRPANHPVRRVMGAAVLAHRYCDSGLLRGIEMLVRQEEVREAVKGLTVEGYIGAGRAADMMVNVALPFFHAFAGLGRDVGLLETSWKVYRESPMLAQNGVTREAIRLLNRPELEIRTARRQQGLMMLYRESVSGQRISGAA
ncbi:MAG: DUF2851 family protein [Chloroflexi bacterium]|nr:DUF2851 family protein [Chloroflexota bacterium]